MGEGMLTSESTPVPWFARIPELKKLSGLPPLPPPGPLSRPFAQTTPGSRARRSLAWRSSQAKVSQLKPADVSLTPVHPRTPQPSLQGGSNSQNLRGQRWLAREQSGSLTWALGPGSEPRTHRSGLLHPSGETPGPEAGRGRARAADRARQSSAARVRHSRGVVPRAPPAGGGAVPPTCAPHVLGPGRTPERRRRRLQVVVPWVFRFRVGVEEH